MVTVRYKNNPEDYADFMRFTAYRVNHKLAKAWVFFAAALALGVVAVFTANAVFIVSAAVFAAFGILLLSLGVTAVKKSVARTLKEYREMHTVENLYRFGESEFTVETKVKGKIKESSVPYGALRYAAETKEFFYLYVRSSLAFLVKKSGIEEGSAKELKELIFSALGKKKCKFKREK